MNNPSPPHSTGFSFQYDRNDERYEYIEQGHMFTWPSAKDGWEQIVCHDHRSDGVCFYVWRRLKQKPMDKTETDGDGEVEFFTSWEYPDTLEIGIASRDYEDRQGRVSPTHSFEAGALWMIDQIKERNPKICNNSKMAVAQSSDPLRGLDSFVWDYGMVD